MLWERQALSITEGKALQGALESAFYTRAELDLLLSLRLDKNLDDITSGGSLNDITTAVIKAAEGEGWTADLIRKAYASRPGNPDLRRFYEKYAGSAQRELDRAFKEKGPDLERAIRRLNAFQDVRAWRERLQEVEAGVCRIETSSSDAGPGVGFLVAPDVVLTCHHKLAKVIDGASKPGDIIVRFDRRQLLDGSTTRGTEHRLHVDWCVASSPLNPVDARRGDDPPPTAMLDYALVRLAQPAADDEVDGRERGFLPFRREAVSLSTGTGLIIAQYPHDGPMKLAIDTQAVTRVAADGSRAYYRNATEPGSSGSPCFSMGWELVAMHVGNAAELVGRDNEGVPLGAIREALPQSARDTVGW